MPIHTKRVRPVRLIAGGEANALSAGCDKLKNLALAGAVAANHANDRGTVGRDNSTPLKCRQCWILICWMRNAQPPTSSNSR